MNESVAIRQALAEDARQAAALGLLLWPDNTQEGLEGEFSGLIASPDGVVFLAVSAGEPVGFAQCQLRHDYVEGTDTSPVGYLEGIFVKEEHRGKGTARALLAACEGWARERGCREFASDCQLHNTQSLGFHLRCGFEEAGRIICFVKPLC